MFVRIMMSLFRESGIRGSTVHTHTYLVGVAKLSVEPGFSSIASVQLRTDYCPLHGVAGCPLFRGF